MCSAGLDACALEEYETENVPAREDWFGEERNLKCEATYDCFDLEHISFLSENKSLNGSCSSITGLVGTASVSVKGLDRVF